MPHDPKLVEAVARALAPQERVCPDPDAVEDLATALWPIWLPPARKALDAIEAAGCEIVRRPKPEQPVVLSVGQRWVPTSAKAKPRVITKIGAHRSYPWAGDTVVYFDVEGEPPRERSRALSDETFKAWAKARGAMVAARPGAQP